MVTEKKKKSMKMQAADRQKLRRFIDSCDSIQEAAEKLNVHRAVLSNLRKLGSAAQTTIEKVLEGINNQTSAK